MTIALDTTALAGGAQTGLTTPTYDSTSDLAPESNGRQYAVTAKGGTQTGVNLHSAALPFTINFTRPKNIRSLGSPNAISGVYGSIPKNTYGVILRKGVYSATDVPQVMVARLSVDVPAGSEVFDAVNIRAGLSYLIGALNDQSAGFGDMCVSGLLG